MQSVQRHNDPLGQCFAKISLLTEPVALLIAASATREQAMADFKTRWQS
jgi:hypothetical protein